ncbi:hypothetical protein ONZ45_g14655 [Pleurotus djamor]|nr:hypothetical protein ONZ45_g14655 [Pleurotus djamor]
MVDLSCHRRELESNGPAPNVPLIAIFDLTQILGYVLLMIIVLTAWFSKSIRRSPAWYNFLITWMISCVSHLVTLGQQTGSHPHFGVCLFQSMLIYAAPAITVSAGLAFSIEMWRIVTRATSDRRTESPRTDVLLIIAPYIVHIVICMEVLSFGLAQRSLVARNESFMFCHLTSGTPALITGCVVILSIVVAVGFLTSTAIHLRKHWLSFRLLQARQVVNIHKMVIRFGIFTILPTLGLILSIAQVTTTLTGDAYSILTIAVGTLPLGAALVFGTQADLLNAWKWKKDNTGIDLSIAKSSNHPPSSVSSTESSIHPRRLTSSSASFLVLLEDSKHIQPNVVLVALFDLTQILGYILLMIIALTAWLSKSIRRSPAWYNFLITWMLSCVSYLVILGQQTSPSEPQFGICLLQSMLIYAAPVVTVTAGLSFSIEMWRIVTRATSGRSAASPKVDVLLIVGPYFIHIAICIEVLVMGLSNRTRVVRDETFMFCHLDSSIPAFITAFLVITSILFVIGFLTSTALHIRKHWTAFRLLQARQVANIRKMVIRFGIFVTLPMLALVLGSLSVTQVTANLTGEADSLLTIAVGTLPLGAALIFGSQADLLDVWMFWRRWEKAEPETDSSKIKPPGDTV